MFLIVFFLVLIVPTFAQDLSTNTPIATVQATLNGTPVEATLIAPVGTPAPGANEPTPMNWLVQVSPWLGAILIVVSVIVGILGRTFIIQLGSSVPIAFYEVSKGAAVAGLDSLGNYVTTTATTIDDEGYTELRKLFDELTQKIEQQRQEQADLIMKHLNPPPAPSAN
jgi:hypothetical protein